MRALLDTSVLLGEPPPAGIEAAISVTSLIELHFAALEVRWSPATPRWARPAVHDAAL